MKAIILVGGASVRMGRDKSLLEYHGVSQRDYLFALLRRFAEEVYLSCHPDRIPETELPILVDTFPDAGPLSGVLTAFEKDPASAWLVVACDMPGLDDEVIQMLVDARDETKLATCFVNSDGLPEPLVAIWEVEALGKLKVEYFEGKRSLMGVLKNNDIQKVVMEDVWKLRNINSEE